jgi:2-octaprenyl-6-methoxyphenol hydroxylase
VGLTLALMLARREVPSTVIDARTVEAARTDRRLLALSRGTLDLLRPLIELSGSAPIESVVVTSAGDFGRVVIDERDVGAGPLGITVRYADLLAPLAQSCEDNERIRVLRPRRVQRIDQRPNLARVALDDGTAVDAALVVNAEGTSASADSTAVPIALVADVVISGSAAGAAYERFTREGPLALLPLPEPAVAEGRALGLVWCMSPVSAERRAALDDAAFNAELQQALGEPRKKIVRTGPRRSYPLHQQARSTLRAHRTVWIGNAAQTLHPVAGQGLNLGMRDAAELADAVAQAIAAGADPAKALDVYENRRRIDRGAIVALTRRLPQLFSTRATPVAIGRSLGLAALAAVPDLRREFARLLMFGVRA